MESEKINASHICSINIRINRINYSYKYYNKIKFLFITFKKEGFYYQYDIPRTICTVEEIESSGDSECRGDVVYYKPYINIKMSDGCNYTKRFDDEGELHKFVNDLTKDASWISIS